jgi:hypothetical protein
MWVQTGDQEMFDEAARCAGTQFQHQFLVTSSGEITLPYKIRVRGVTETAGTFTYDSDWGKGYSVEQRTEGSTDFGAITDGVVNSRVWDVWGVFAAQFCAYYGSAEHPDAQRYALQFLSKYTDGQPNGHAHAHFASTVDALIPTRGHRGL